MISWGFVDILRPQEEINSGLSLGKKKNITVSIPEGAQDSDLSAAAGTLHSDTSVGFNYFFENKRSKINKIFFP